MKREKIFPIVNRFRSSGWGRGENSWDSGDELVSRAHSHGTVTWCARVLESVSSDAPDQSVRRLSRRRALALGVGGVGIGLAGCLGDSGDDEGSAPAESQENRQIAGAPPTNVDLPVSDEKLTRGAPRDAIRAIDDPVFGSDWAGVSAEVPVAITSIGRPRKQTIEPRLADDDTVIGVSRAGEARAYPLRVLNWHEVVNDSFGGPLLVSYCPLCRTAITAERRAGGRVTRFGVTGLLFRDDLVMYDEATDSRWSQLLATAIQGKLTGEQLELVPSTLTTLGAWRKSHPDTAVLRPPPESGMLGEGGQPRDYTIDPYTWYQTSEVTGVGGQFEGSDASQTDGESLHPKAVVLGVAHDGQARAYPAEAVREVGIVEERVGGLPIVVTTAPGGTPVAWSREVEGSVLSFAVAGERHLSAGGSRWRRATGDAVDGPYEGKHLTQANAVSPLFWFAWLEFYPETELYGSGE